VIFFTRPAGRVLRLALLPVAILFAMTACQKDNLTELASTETSGLAADRQSNTVVDIALSNPDFSTLVAAVVKTGQVGFLSAAGLDATVFAPTNAAFANLPAPLNNAANIKSITDPATINLLRNVLQYHLIGARVFSADLREGISAPTLLAGNNVSITLAGGPKVKGTGNTNGSNIVATDILARNGVIHVIDQVLLP